MKGSLGGDAGAPPAPVVALLCRRLGVSLFCCKPGRATGSAPITTGCGARVPALSSFASTPRPPPQWGPAFPPCSPVAAGGYSSPQTSAELRAGNFRVDCEYGAPVAVRLPGTRGLKPGAACSARLSSCRPRCPRRCWLTPRLRPPSAVPPHRGTFRETWANSTPPSRSRVGRLRGGGCRAGGAPQLTREFRAGRSLGALAATRTPRVKAEGREGRARTTQSQLPQVQGSQGEAAPGLMPREAGAVPSAQPGALRIC